MSDLVQDDYDNYAPAYSPTENKFIYCSRRGEDYFIMLADFDRGSFSVLSRCSILDPLFAWSPDGKHVAFTDRENGELHVILLDLSQAPGLSSMF
jgi:Tol biopolymer transport system component